jgi:hypothetical protein
VQSFIGRLQLDDVQVTVDTELDIRVTKKVGLTGAPMSLSTTKRWPRKFLRVRHHAKSLTLSSILD